MRDGFGEVGAIVVPYDSGAREWRTGRGPMHLARGGLLEDLGAGEETVEVDGALRTENAAAFELMRRISGRVRASVTAGRFPLVVSGNCNASVGAVAGAAGGEALGVVWFDAHADFNTPETTSSGFLDGMALAMVAGRCWTGMTRSVPGFVPVRGEDVVLVGARDVDPGERLELADAGVAVVESASEPGGRSGGLTEALDGLRARVGRVHVHVDLDALDPELVGSANRFASPGGLSAEGLERVLGLVADRFDVVSGTMASYDPDLDGEGRVLDAARRLARALSGHAGGRTVG